MARALARTALIVALSACAGSACSLLTSFGDLTGAASDASTSDALTMSGEASAAMNDAAPSDDGSAVETDGDAAAPICPAPLISAGLVAYYPLNETSGAVAHDCSGNAFDATLSPTDVAHVKGHFGNGVAFGGTKGCMELPAPTPIALKYDGTSAFTVTMWVLIAQYNSNWSRAFLVGQSADPSKAGWRLSVENGAMSYAIAFGIGAGGEFGNTAASSVALDTWHNIAVTYSVNMNQSNLLIDGVSKAQLATGSFPVDTVSLRVGCSGDDQNYLIGAVDEVRFYNRALSLSDLQLLAK